jgi:hypothetical protein
MKQLTCLLALSLVAFACASSDDDEPDTASAFCERWADAACSDEVVSACGAAGAEDCRAAQAARCLSELPSGTFSGERADQCLESIEAAYRDADLSSDELGTVLRFQAPCDQLIRGLAAEGESCTARADCNAPAGFDCVFKADAATGTCRRPASVGAGEDCSAPNAVCGAGFYCNGENCIAGENVGEACTSTRQCSSSSFCGLTSSCEARLPIDAPCGFDEQCNSGLCYRFSPTEQVCADRVRLSRSEPTCDDLR